MPVAFRQRAFSLPGLGGLGMALWRERRDAGSQYSSLGVALRFRTQDALSAWRYADPRVLGPFA